MRQPGDGQPRRRCQPALGPSARTRPRRDRDADPAAAEPVPDPDPHQLPEPVGIWVFLLDDRVVDLLRDHEDQRGSGSLLQCPLQSRRLEQPERRVDIVAVEAVLVLMDLSSVDHGPQPQLQLRPGGRGIVLVEQPGQHRDEPLQDHGLGHLVIRPDQDHHAVPAVSLRFQVLVDDPRCLQSPLRQPVQPAPELPFVPVGPRRGSLDVQHDDRAVHRSVRQAYVQALYRRQQNAHLPFPPVCSNCLHRQGDR